MIDNGCYRDGLLAIDGGYGDYRMSIFRLKDRNKRMKELPTIFTTSFVNDANRLAPDSAEYFNRIISIPNKIYLEKNTPEDDEDERNKFKMPKWCNE